MDELARPGQGGRTGHPAKRFDQARIDQAPKENIVTAVPGIMLNNGNKIPQFGFGVFQIAS